MESKEFLKTHLADLATDKKNLEQAMILLKAARDAGEPNLELEQQIRTAMMRNEKWEKAVKANMK